MKRSREPEEHLESGAQETPRDEQPAEQPRHVKTPAIDDDDDDDGPEFAMRCSLPPHREAIGFRSYGDYEAHYQRDHTNRCLECRRNFPSEHLLGIHIEECHDPLARVARERGEHTYSCFVEGCERKCMTPQKRRMHLIDKHAYPKNFFFAVTKQGVDGRRSLLHEGGERRRRSSSGAAAQQAVEGRRRGSAQEPSHAPGQQGARTRPKPGTEPPTEEAAGPVEGAGGEPRTEKAQQDVEMAELTGAMSALQFVPPSVRFGRGRAGFSRR